MEIAGEHHPAAGLAVARAYHALLRASPGLWGELYRAPWARAVLRGVRSAYLNLGGAARMKRGVRRSGAGVVVCPQASVAAVLSEARRRGDLEIPVVSVLTDWAVHPFWADPPADLVLAPDEEAAAELRRLGAPAVLVTGIPVHPAFAKPPSRAEARRALALPESAPVALLSGGGKGLGGLDRAASALLSASPRARLLVLCGANDRLRASLARRADAGERLRVFGPQPPAVVASLTAAADVHVGKPGGLSAAESLAMGLPMVLARPLPGQETGNAARLTALGAAVLAETPELAGELAAELLGDRTRLSALADRARAAGRPDAAAAAARAASCVLDRGLRAG